MLNRMARLNAERDGRWIGCLDFGTSYSKFAMVRAEDREDLEDGDVRPLFIGDLESASRGLLLPSTLFLTPEHVLFGDEAQRAAVQAAAQGRHAFQAPKQYLSTHELDQINSQLPIDIDPTGRYTPRKLIVLYLTFLLLKAEASAHEFGIPWPPKLRVARPAWDEKRAKAGEALLQEMVRDAFVLADALSDKLSPDGMSHSDITEAFGLLDWAGAGWNNWQSIFHLDRSGGASVLEATAVAAASISPRGPRRVVVVADIGGGTSDFAAFMTGLPGNNVVAEVPESAGVLRRAGDHIDMLLRSFILKEAAYLEDDTAAAATVMRLRLRQRQLKEDLFREGHIAVELVDELVEISLSDFERFQPVEKFASDLRSVFQKTLGIAVDIARNFLPGAQLPVEIMLTGGGNSLPMVRRLADSPGIAWSVESVDPEVVGTSEDPDLARLAPQLAVAIGGAVLDLPVQTAPVRKA